MPLKANAEVKVRMQDFRSGEKLTCASSASGIASGSFTDSSTPRAATPGGRAQESPALAKGRRVLIGSLYTLKYIDREERLGMSSRVELDLAALGLGNRMAKLGRPTALDITSRRPLRQVAIEISEPAPRRRTKIWEFANSLHCSIIGTCLTTAELRQVLTKMRLASESASDHDLHAEGVALAGRHDKASKLLNKTLDQRHRLAIRQFDKAVGEADVRVLWRAAVQRGEIPGAYWAALTHPATTPALLREIFGEVHMLSHLVGAANRADIRRLGQLEGERAGLEAKLQRQQNQLRDVVSARDAMIRDLQGLLSRKIADEAATDALDGAPAGHEALTRLVADLERRLAAEARRRGVIERRLEQCEADLGAERELRGAAERREHALRADLEAVEASIAAAAPLDGAVAIEPARLDGLSLLYVGGRPNQMSHLRALAERRGVLMLHHDGGIEDRDGLLQGLVNRADAVMFPIDCVSHQAVSLVKRLCQRAVKPFVPLRSSGLSSFIAALERPEIAALRGMAGV